MTESAPLPRDAEEQVRNVDALEPRVDVESLSPVRSESPRSDTAPPSPLRSDEETIDSREAPASFIPRAVPNRIVEEMVLDREAVSPALDFQDQEVVQPREAPEEGGDGHMGGAESRTGDDLKVVGRSSEHAHGEGVLDEKAGDAVQIEPFVAACALQEKVDDNDQLGDGVVGDVFQQRAHEFGEVSQQRADDEVSLEKNVTPDAVQERAGVEVPFEKEVTPDVLQQRAGDDVPPEETVVCDSLRLKADEDGPSEDGVAGDVSPERPESDVPFEEGLVEDVSQEQERVANDVQLEGGVVGDLLQGSAETDVPFDQDADVEETVQGLGGAQEEHDFLLEWETELEMEELRRLDEQRRRQEEWVRQLALDMLAQGQGPTEGQGLDNVDEISPGSGSVPLEEEPEALNDSLPEAPRCAEGEEEVDEGQSVQEVVREDRVQNELAEQDAVLPECREEIQEEKKKVEDGDEEEDEENEDHRVSPGPVGVHGEGEDDGACEGLDHHPADSDPQGGVTEGEVVTDTGRESPRGDVLVEAPQGENGPEVIVSAEQDEKDSQEASEEVHLKRAEVLEQIEETVGEPIENHPTSEEQPVLLEKEQLEEQLVEQEEDEHELRHVLLEHEGGRQFEEEVVKDEDHHEREECNAGGEAPMVPFGVVSLGEDVPAQALAAEPPVEVPLPQIHVTPLQVQNPQNGEDPRRRKDPAATTHLLSVVVEKPRATGCFGRLSSCCDGPVHDFHETRVVDREATWVDPGSRLDASWQVLSSTWIRKELDPKSNRVYPLQAGDMLRATAIVREELRVIGPAGGWVSLVSPSGEPLVMLAPPLDTSCEEYPAVDLGQAFLDAVARNDVAGAGVIAQDLATSGSVLPGHVAAARTSLAESVAEGTTDWTATCELLDRALFGPPQGTSQDMQMAICRGDASTAEKVLRRPRAELELPTALPLRHVEMVEELFSHAARAVARRRSTAPCTCGMSSCSKCRARIWERLLRVVIIAKAYPEGTEAHILALHQPQFITVETKILMHEEASGKYEYCGEWNRRHAFKQRTQGTVHFIRWNESEWWIIAEGAPEPLYTRTGGQLPSVLGWLSFRSGTADTLAVNLVQKTQEEIDGMFLAGEFYSVPALPTNKLPKRTRAAEEPTRPQVQALTPPQVQAPTPPQVQAPTPAQIQAPTSPQVQTPTSPQVQAPAQASVLAPDVQPQQRTQAREEELPPRRMPSSTSGALVETSAGEVDLPTYLTTLVDDGQAQARDHFAPSTSSRAEVFDARATLNTSAGSMPLPSYLAGLVAEGPSSAQVRSPRGHDEETPLYPTIPGYFGNSHVASSAPNDFCMPGSSFEVATTAGQMPLTGYLAGSIES
uniref:Uncharacterized protein n=1 Tax=Noctiluca scintillans TaxID=2966 RepID=A0A7S1AST0_NOCSC|mmetsp:Transcript_58550/g.155884  ORF Transcript_58550/g.155884 Transcript_58550/m.155884 type:complete len:1350 (+) Transcript_58550:81-4130(+)